MTRIALRPDQNGLARVAAAAGETATPFYLYDTEVFAARIRLLQSVLSGAHVLYSAKANPHRRLLALAKANGCGLELASGGELEAAVAAGVSLSQAILVGPAKSADLLRTAVEAGIGRVVLESERELRRVLTVVGAGPGPALRTMLRLNLDGARGRLRMSGHQFGMGKDEAARCLALIDASPRLAFVGYHGYLASQLLDPGDIAHNAMLVLSAVEELDRHGKTAAEVDLGGGFGIAYAENESDLDLHELRERAISLRLAAGDAALVFESGRFLVGPAGALVCRVVDVKESGGRRFVLLDGGMNASGLFGAGNASRGLRHTVLSGEVPRTGGPVSNICGPLCTPMDRLATGVACAAEVDDLVVWWNMGAYGATAAPVNFLSFAHPAEVVV